MCYQVSYMCINLMHICTTLAFVNTLIIKCSCFCIFHVIWPVPLKFHPKIFCPYIGRYVFRAEGIFYELLNIRALERFWNGPRFSVSYYDYTKNIQCYLMSSLSVTGFVFNPSGHNVFSHVSLNPGSRGLPTCCYFCKGQWCLTRGVLQ